ncbi:MAG: hypothetical protein I3273_00780 [Candidatus Moeniiplasma glomeromycotorum]|nr:hypothetical protein [Candidatus Moeniiplasma glomeromycotorum]MCE8167342.1 hypothetical protein [Candidatus Moeniiplasma glomeromycotorum]MCE8168645.1 hypothetical protein [Candidatus Moeniiplasma glomeromycotorum]
MNNINKKPNTWEELDTKWVRENLEKTKSGSIAFIKDKDKLNRWDIYHAHWENYLTSHDYWKNWQTKINNFQTQKEVNFYTDRLRAFIDFVKENTRKDIRYVENAKPWDPIKTPKLIEQELKRLESISEEEFKKTDKWGQVEWKKLSVEEMLNDKWFSKEIDNLFGKNIEKGENKETYHQPKNEVEQKQPSKQNPEKLENEQRGETNSTQKDEVQAQKAKPSPGNSDWKSKGLICGSIGAIGLVGVVVMIKLKKSF